MSSSTVIEQRHYALYSVGLPGITQERSEGKPPRWSGYAIPFGKLSKDLGGFRERVLPSALDRIIRSGADVRALVDHDHSKILGRTSAGTLRIGKDNTGLWFNLDMPDVSYARDVQVSIDRGDIRGMSFGFRVSKGGDRFTYEAGETIREILDMELKEITVTSIPAYGDTSVSLRVDPAVTARAKVGRWNLASAWQHLRKLQAE